ncbi:hypothetical protein QEG98_17265 [Myxococcus sp. MxC21-1]|uniref:hypothetical protein n=1 Tax=Myxococcus sp. MxC21-1 TaxID=3041439 RepID=UPI00292DEA15|nr:hypothetical protein [Myxococcus sp. MxC21-1]WNZ65221.1 hypothetical protein QEG98_17265 [Myxococcus sp. MxC21-1]
MMPPLVLLGSGYTLTRLAVAEARAGRDVLAATRDAARRAELERAGARVTDLEDALTRTAGAHVVVSVPPDAGLDTRIASALAGRFQRGSSTCPPPASMAARGATWTRTPRWSCPRRPRASASRRSRAISRWAPW